MMSTYFISLLVVGIVLGLINTANAMRASAWPKPEAFPGIALPLDFRRRTPSRTKSPANLAEAIHS